MEPQTFRNTNDWDHYLNHETLSFEVVVYLLTNQDPRAPGKISPDNEQDSSMMSAEMLEFTRYVKDVSDLLWNHISTRRPPFDKGYRSRENISVSSVLRWVSMGYLKKYPAPLMVAAENSFRGDSSLLSKNLTVAGFDCSKDDFDNMDTFLQVQKQRGVLVTQAVENVHSAKIALRLNTNESLSIKTIRHFAEQQGIYPPEKGGRKPNPEK